MSDKQFDIQWRGPMRAVVGGGTPSVVLKQHGAEGMTLEQAKDIVCTFWADRLDEASRMIAETAVITVDDFITISRPTAQEAFEKHMNRHQASRTEMWRGFA